MRRYEKLRSKLTGQEQISEALVLNLILALSGGFQDAYTYIVRDHIFSNAQTGNVVLMSTFFMQGQWREGISYLFPILAFMLGTFAAANIGTHWKNAKKLHWRQGVLAIEMLLLFAVGFIPDRYNMAANIIVSFSCAMQVQSFRSVAGNAYASTMCIGNLRNGTAALSAYFNTREKKYIEKALFYFVVILFFAVGAGIGGTVSGVLGIRAIWISCALLMGCFAVMELDREW